MKTNELIQKNIRDYVQLSICRSLYSDRELTLKWILRRFEDRDKKLSIDSLIELSSEFSAFLPQNPYSTNTMQIYKDLGLSETMSYTQFIFELPRIWYTTLYRLIVEWRDESDEYQETVY
jgi:hypothetical protein